MKSIFTTIICLAVANVVVAASDAVIWQQELSCGSNLTCKPRAIMVDSKNNELIVLGSSESSDTREVDLQLWKIDPNGTVKNNKSLGLLSEYGSFVVGPFGIKTCIMPNTGDIVGLKLDDVNNISLFVTSRSMQSIAIKLNTPPRKLSETLILHDMISCQNDNLLFVGQDRGKDGIVIRTDLAGNVIWEKIFDREQVDILSSITCTADGTDFYVVGMSASMAGKMSFANAATVYLLRYGGNGELKASDFFEGGLAPWPSSLPKVIYFPSGIVLVVYDKSVNGMATELYAKAYTRELTPLWEKQILQTKEDGPPALFDICVTPEDRFVLAGKVNFRDLRVYEYKADGTILQTLELDGEVGAGGIYVDYLDGKILVASATRLTENEKKAKIKLLALKPYKTN